LLRPSKQDEPCAFCIGCINPPTTQSTSSTPKGLTSRDWWSESTTELRAANVRAPTNRRLPAGSEFGRACGKIFPAKIPLPREEWRTLPNEADGGPDPLGIPAIELQMLRQVILAMRLSGFGLTTTRPTDSPVVATQSSGRILPQALESRCPGHGFDVPSSARKTLPLPLRSSPSLALFRFRSW